MEIKYSVSFTANPTAPNYSLAMQRWGIDYNGNRHELGSEVKTGLTFAQCLTEIENFKQKGGENG